MNLTVNEEFQPSCQKIGDKHFLIRELPSKNLVTNHIFAIVFNSIVIIPTLLLNGVSVITILKSLALRSKPCYFIILLQSIFDLAVGTVGIPSFIFLLASAIGGISNCLAVSLATRLMLAPIGVSTIIATAMTIERYIAILHPYTYKNQVTIKRILVSVGSSCVVDISLMNVIVAVQNLVRIYIVAKFTFFFFFTAYAYTRICSVVRNLARSQMKPHDADENMNVTKMKKFLQEVKQARSCFIVVVCFFVLVFLPPAVVAPFVDNSNEFKELGMLIWVISINFVNSSANSVVFFWTKTMLRKQALKLLNFRSTCSIY